MEPADTTPPLPTLTSELEMADGVKAISTRGTHISAQATGQAPSLSRRAGSSMITDDSRLWSSGGEEGNCTD